MVFERSNPLFLKRIYNKVFYKDYAPNSSNNYHDESEERDLNNYKDFLKFDFQKLYARADKGKLFLGYEDLFNGIEGFSQEVIESRFSQLKLEIESFLEKENYYNYAKCNDMLLGYAVIDYFVDIKRLKSFHKITHTNTSKIYAYMAYWLLREQPIQITNENLFNSDEKMSSSEANKCLYLNAKFVAGYLMSNMLSDLSISLEYINNSEELKNYIGDFMSLLIYNFKYRSFNPQSLEIMITAFITGFKISTI